MLCTFCRQVSGSIRHVNAHQARRSAALHLTPNVFSRSQHVRIHGNGGSRLIRNIHSVRGGASDKYERHDEHEATDIPLEDKFGPVIQRQKRKQKSLGKEDKARDASDAEQSTESDWQPSTPQPKEKVAIGSGPRAMRAVRRKRAQGAAAVPLPGKEPTKAATAPPEKEEKHKPEPWQVQKAALVNKFKDGYAPRKRLSPDSLPGIRMLHASDPATFTTPVLAEHFKVSPEAVRRILKSKWRPSEAEEEERRLRWDKRGQRIWTAMADMGTKPPKKWRSMGVGRVNRKAGEVPAWKRRKKSTEVGRAQVGRPVGGGYVPFVEDLNAEVVSLRQSPGSWTG